MRLIFKTVNETLVKCVTIQMKAIEQYFHVVLFITLLKVVLTFKSVNETLVCDHSNESYRAVLSCGSITFAVQATSRYFQVVLFVFQYIANDFFFFQL